MVTPARRTGFSRRAQYGVFAGYVVAIAGIAAALLLAVTARFDPAGHARAAGAVADLTAPVSGAARGTLAGVNGAGDAIGAYFDAAAKNRALAAEVRADRALLLAARATAAENVRLKRLLRLVERDGRPVAVARLVSSSGSTARRFALLGAGTGDGVRVGQPVRTDAGLVGRVTDAGQRSARVVLITDAGNVVPVRRLSDGLPALATGRGDAALDVRALQAAANPFKVGDVLVSSGAGGVFPPDVPVAVVRRVTREAALAVPLADPDALDVAVVLPPFVEPPPAPPAGPGAPAR